MDVLTVAGMFIILVSGVWICRRMRRVADSANPAQAVWGASHVALPTPDGHDHVVLFNPAAERLFGRGRLPVNRSAVATLHPEDTAHVTDAGDAGATAGAAQLHSIAVGDIAGTRHRCDASAENDARYRTFIELNPIATWLMRDGVIACINRPCLVLLGVAEPAEVVGTSASGWLDAEGLKGVRRQVAGLSGARGAATKPTAGKVNRRDGLTRDVDVMAIASDHARHASILVTLHDVTQRNATERELRGSRQALRELARTLQRAREAERTSLAHQLHEGLAQQVNIIKMEIAALNARYPALTNRDGFVNASNRKIGTHLDNLVARVRQLTAELRPPMLDDLGLAATLEWLAQDLCSRYGLEIDTELAETGIDSAAACVLYRITREALEYARLREPVSRISVHLLTSGDFVTLTVREDGQIDDAFVSGQRPSVLFSIREQVATIGGDADWKTLRSGGQELVIHLSARARR